MIRGLARLAVVGTAVAWLADVVLAARRAGRPPTAIRSHVVIDAPPDRVWQLLADVERQPTWMHDLKSVTLLTPGPVGVGTRAIGRVRILGVAVDDPIEVTAFEPPRRFEIRHEGTFRGKGVIELEPGVDGTTTIVRWAEVLVPPVLPHVVAAVQRPILRAIFQADLHRLRQLLEAPA